MINDRNTACHGRFLPCLLIIVFLSFSCLGIPPAGAGSRIVTVGVYENAPKIFTDESGKPAGVFIDIVEDIAKKEGWTLRYRSGTWGEGLDRLERGEIDLMPDVAYTAERARIYDFHNVPVLSSWYQVYAPKGSRIQSILDLNKKRILVLERSVQQDAFARISKGFGLNCTLIAVPDYNTMFEVVARGDADAAITNRFYGMMHAKKFGLTDTTIIFEPSDLFFAAPKISSLASSASTYRLLLNAIDNDLSDLKKDPKSIYYASLKRWTSEEVQFKLPEWVQLTGLGVGILLFMSFAGSMILKHQVNARTLELRQINQEMEQRIVARTAELAGATEKAQAADRIKSAFLATMSHELRTPLNSIIGFTGILLQGLAGPLNMEQQKQMGMVQSSARHLLALINDVLDISKIESGQLTLARDSFDLRASIEKMAKVVSPLAGKKGIDLRMDISGEIGTITSDQRRLEQVILNLINNAVKFTEKGHVAVACRADNGHYRLSVSDTGIGIKPEEIPDLFQPFHQIDAGLTRKHEGTGLGLSISKKIVDMMGGTIDVASRWGEGSTFTVRLPRESA